MNLVTILFAILALSILVVAHELGHFLSGKWLGFDIYEFAIGFGPKILKKESKGTIFSIRAFPLGGFVAFDDEKNIENGELSFDKKPIWKRLIVILAGPVMNIIAALIIMIGVFTVSGVDLVDEPLEYYVSGVIEGGPAYDAGMENGDVFYMMEGQLVDGNYDVISDSLQDEDGLNVTVIRDGEKVELFLLPEYVESEGKYKIDIGVANRYQREKVSFFEAARAGTVAVFSMTKELVVYLGRLVSTGEGAKDMGSIIGAVAVMSDVAQQMDIYYFLYILAFISINLGIINLLPIPPCDGFKVLMYLFEGIRGKKISFETQMKIQVAGFIVLFGLSIILMYRDVVRLITGG